MKKLTYTIIHFRFLFNDSNTPISMRDWRILRDEVEHANEALKASGNSLEFPFPELSAYGGYTVVAINDNETNEQWIGISKCNPGLTIVDEHGKIINVGGDRFVRRLGVERASAAADNQRNHGSTEETIDFVQNKADKQLFDYLRENELLDDESIDDYDTWQSNVRQNRSERREKSQSYVERRERHTRHLIEQRERANEWHRTHPQT